MVMFNPPYIVTQAQIDEIIALFEPGTLHGRTTHWLVVSRRLPEHIRLVSFTFHLAPGMMGLFPGYDIEEARHDGGRRSGWRASRCDCLLT